MTQVAQDAQRYADENPRLPVLFGYPYASRAATLADRGDYEEAIPEYEKALAFGEHGNWRQKLAHAHYLIENYHQAIRDANVVLEQFPNRSYALVVRGSAWSSLGRGENALRDLDGAIENSPAYTEAFEARGLAHFRLHDFEAAVRDLRRAAELQPDREWTLRLLGKTLAAKLGRHEEAVAVYRRLTEIAPDDASYWLDYGESLHAVADPGAEAVLRRFLELADASNSNQLAGISRVKRLLDPAADVHVEESGSLPALSLVKNQTTQ
jgi:tetratricopeptide (TPR) repeat protein